MKKIDLLRASVFASFLVYLPVRLSLVQATIVLFLVMSIGLVEAGNTEMVRVIELHLSSASTHVARDDLSALPPTDITVTALSHKRRQGKSPRQRNPKLSLQHLIVVGMNAQEEETSRTVILDPRIVRAETAEPSGTLTTSGLRYRSNVIFSVTMPDDPSIIALRIYQPRWTGKEFTLDLISEASLREVKSHD